MPSAPPAPSATVPAPPGRRRRPWAAILLAAGLVLFGLGVVRLFELRFDVGDVYPAYSTLRSDPIGSEALFESLQDLPGFKVERSLRPLPWVGRQPMAGEPTKAEDAAIACFYLGAESEKWPFLLDLTAVERLETIARSGGRVIVTFLPAMTAPTTARLDEVRKLRRDSTDPTDAQRRPPVSRLAARHLPPDLITRWGLDFRRLGKAASASVHSIDITPASADKDSAAHIAGGIAAAPAYPEPSSGIDAGPAPWHSALDFNLGTFFSRVNQWHALYRRYGRPVIVSRPFGSSGGELILVSDTFFLSNEGLRDAPQAALLAGLVGAKRHVIFDESHLGVSDSPGLMTLARRYRLGGAIAALGLLVALFIWRNVVSLVPPRQDESDAASGGAGGVGGMSGNGGTGEMVVGRDSAAGFLNLVRRGVRARDLPAVCLAQWEGTQGLRGNAQKDAAPRLHRILEEEIRAAGKRAVSPASVYRAMCVALRPRR